MQLMGLADLSPEMRQRWAGARVWAAHEAPYLASALLALQPVVVDLRDDPGAADLRAFPADVAWHLYIDPQVLMAADVPTLGFWLLHQVSHLLRDHADRYRGEPLDLDAAGPFGARQPDQTRWNVACDAEINDDLSTALLEPPAEALQPAALGLAERLMAEQYWDALGDHPSAEAQRVMDDSCDCGSGSDGQQRSWDCGQPGVSATGARLVARDTARQIRAHSQQREDTPAGWQRWAEEILEPSVNWRRQLAAQIRRGAADVAGAIDFTYQRPSRRASATPNVIMPSLRQPLPQVAVIIDTSGSMSDGMLGQALSEVHGVLRSLGVGRRHLKLIACDARAHGTQQVRDLGAISLAGGGGTDLRAGIDAAISLRPRPQLLIILTDGHTTWRSVPPPGVRVVVGLMDRAGSTPDWAQTVLVGDLAEQAV